MMRCLLLLALVMTVVAKDEAKDEAKDDAKDETKKDYPAKAALSCQSAGVSLLKSGSKAALFMFAAGQHCKQQSVYENRIECTTDISATIEQVDEVAGEILQMVESCPRHFDQVNLECGIVANELVAAAAGGTEAAAEIVQFCGALDLQPPGGPDDVKKAKQIDVGQCATDGLAALTEVGQGFNVMRELKKQCGDDDSQKCAAASVAFSSVISKFGGYIAGITGNCLAAAGIPCFGDNKEQVERQANCASAVMKTVGELTKISKVGLKLKDVCAPSESSRLYLDHEPPTATGSPSVLALAAFLPVAMVLSFVAGRRFARPGTATSVRSHELLENGPE